MCYYLTYILWLFLGVAHSATPPGPATLNLLTGDTDRIVIGWDPPTDDGGSLVTGYYLFMKEVTESTFVLSYDGSTNSYDTVVAITSYNSAAFQSTTYEFKLVALNAEGAGVDSSVLTVRVEAPTSLSKSIVNGKAIEQLLVNSKGSFTVQTVDDAGNMKTTGNDVIFMTVSDVCRQSVNFACDRVSKSHPHYVDDILLTPIKGQLQDNYNGTYTGEYQIDEKGYVSVMLYAYKNGGLYGEYYLNTDFLGTPAKTQIDPTLNMEWGLGPIINDVDDFVSIRWTGKIRAPSTDYYTFGMYNDNGAGLYIDGNLVIDGRGSCCNTVYGSYDLVKDRFYDISVFLVEDWGLATIIISWSTATIPYQVIPSQYLWYPTLLGKSPYDVSIVKKAPYLCYALGNSLSTATVHELQTFQIYGFYEDHILPISSIEDLTVTFVGPYPEQAVTNLPVVHLGGNVFESQYTPAKAGNYTLEITQGGECIQGSPFSIKVYEIECHPFCDKCVGKTSKDCVNCKEGVAYSVEGQPEICVQNCEEVGSYYLDANTCKKCAEECESCVSQNYCLRCKNIEKVQHLGQCVDSCEDGYYVSNRVCQKCHGSCDTCFAGGVNSCITCAEDLLFWESSCLKECLPGTYNDAGICYPCPKNCSECFSPQNCTKCNQGYFLNATNYSCAEVCMNGTYPNRKTATCDICNAVCETCFGPTSKDCIDCNKAKGFTRYQINGECLPLFCDGATFKEIVNGTPICEECYTRCLTCSGPNSDDCLSCRPGYITMSTKKGTHVKCLSCTEIGPGLYFSEDTCKEVCGDGINSGQYECDDGNLFNGDGCSADCKLEYGYECRKSVDGPDVCFDVLPPVVTAKNDKRNNIILTFSETVKTPYNTKELYKNIGVRVEGVREDCKFTYELQPILKEFNKLNITTEIGCSVKGNVETFVVTIYPNASIKDYAGNDLANNVLEVKVYRRLHISQGEKRAAEGCGSAFESTSLLTFVFSLGIILFQYFIYYGSNKIGL